MSISKLTINIGNVGSNSQPITGDYVSALLFYNAVLPQSGWTVQQIGSAADLAVWGITSTTTGSTANAYYQVSQYFRMNPTSTLFVDFITGTTSSATTFQEVVNTQIFAQGSIKQFGIVMNNGGIIATDIAALKLITTTLKNTYYSPAQIIYSPNVTSFVIAGAANLYTFAASNVTCVIGSDASTYGVGNQLTTTLGYTASMVGAMLGAVSVAPVNQDVAQPIQNYNLSNGTEFVNVKIGNTLLSQVTPTQQDILDSVGYVFMVQKMNVNGTFVSMDRVCNSTIPAINNLTGQVTQVADAINMERVLNKAFRGVYFDLIQKLNSEVAIDNTTGFIDQTIISVWENDAIFTASQMLPAHEISGIECLIDPRQNIFLTNNLNVAVEIIPYLTIYTITVNIGFAQNF